MLARRRLHAVLSGLCHGLQFPVRPHRRTSTPRSKRMSYLYLALAIVAEVIATSALKASNEFTRLWPSVVVVVGYLAAFYLLSLVLRSVPVGIAYAFWAGLGIVLVTLVGIVVYGEKPDLPAVIGLTMIVGGVAVIQLFSSVSSH
ncbi:MULTISPECIES: multidrug efflux SMR transporter [unclassified Halomonas]|uniref:DMT family transporter n=2 Tax=Halomonadaceae TaxID=28256 RepID=UPI00257E1618|nr:MULTISPECIES: multidrug efflux SMR transporter [unclassified Halomonas]